MNNPRKPLATTGNFAVLLAFALAFLYYSRFVRQAQKNEAPGLSLEYPQEKQFDPIVGNTIVLGEQSPFRDETRTQRLLVIVSRYKEDVRWLDDVQLDVHIYQAADLAKDGRVSFPGSSAKANVSWPRWFLDARPDILIRDETISKSSSLVLPDISSYPLHMIPNHGAEAMAFLTAILDFWDDLPAYDYVVCLHGHRSSWHNVIEQKWLLQRLKTHPPIPDFNYSSLVCAESHPEDLNKFYLTNPDANAVSVHGARWFEAAALRMREVYLDVLAKYLGPMPDYIEAPCCASFIASTHSGIFRRPKRLYMELRDWLLENGHHKDAGYKFGGIALEYLWHLLFAGTPVFARSQEECMCDLYSLCNNAV